MDVDCAFKLFKADLFKKIEIESTDAFIDAEIMLKARLLGYSVTEMGVKHLPRLAGVSTGARLGVILRTIREIYRFYRKYGKQIRRAAAQAHQKQPKQDEVLQQ
jgi:hypothetical protein